MKLFLQFCLLLKPKPNLANMKKILCFALLTFTLSFFCLGQGTQPAPDCNKDVKDHREKMKP